MTRAGSKLVLRTSPAPGHYLCIKWDFASLPLRAAARCVCCYTVTALLVQCKGRPALHSSYAERGRAVQRLVAETVDVERETALVVGSDNVLLGVRLHTHGTYAVLPDWGAFPVVRLSIR